jgi:hypothetical protein
VRDNLIWLITQVVNARTQISDPILVDLQLYTGNLRLEMTIYGYFDYDLIHISLH